MPLQEYMMPNETITYEAPFNVKVGDLNYALKITNKRLILFIRKGLIFKRDHFIGEYLDKIDSIAYHETGIIRKTGIISIQTSAKILSMKQKADSMKVIYQQLQGFTNP